MRGQCYLKTVTIGCDEVQTHVDPGVVISREVPLDLELLLQPGLELAVDVVHNALEAVLLVDLVTIAHSVHLDQSEGSIKS